MSCFDFEGNTFDILTLIFSILLLVNIYYIKEAYFLFLVC